MVTYCISRLKKLEKLAHLTDKNFSLKESQVLDLSYLAKMWYCSKMSKGEWASPGPISFNAIGIFEI